MHIYIRIHMYMHMHRHIYRDIHRHKHIHIHAPVLRWSHSSNFESCSCEVDFVESARLAPAFFESVSRSLLLKTSEDFLTSVSRAIMSSRDCNAVTFAGGSGISFEMSPILNSSNCSPHLPRKSCRSFALKSTQGEENYWKRAAK